MIEFTAKENVYFDLDSEGNVVSMTVEHANEKANEAVDSTACRDVMLPAGGASTPKTQEAHYESNDKSGIQ